MTGDAQRLQIAWVKSPPAILDWLNVISDDSWSFFS
jgi:hypothetical protein